MQNAECRSGPKATAVRDVQDAGCRMRNAKLTHSQERADRVPMQDVGAECKNSPNIGRRGQKRVVQNAQCRCRIQNPTQECTVCAESVCMVQMLSIQTANCMQQVSDRGG